jgi:hypothetical protein
VEYIPLGERLAQVGKGRLRFVQVVVDEAFHLAARPQLEQVADPLQVGLQVAGRRIHLVPRQVMVQ